MSTVIQGDFPFEEIRDPSGDLFSTWQEAKDAGFDDDQIWSVVADDDSDTWIYGPPHHYVNRLGYVCTNERHDHDTYYEESWDSDDPADDADKDCY